MGISLTATQSKITAVILTVAAVLTAVAAVVTTLPAQAAQTVLVRGVVKPGGDGNSINLYITHVANAADPTVIRGIRTDVNLSSAKRYKWEVRSGQLQKVRTTSTPTPEKEVVVYGTMHDDQRITASWIVQNYREFTIEGTLEGVTTDTGKTDQGWVTVNVSKSVFRDVSPEKSFKETRLKGKDWKFRVNGTTSLTALGKAKQLDEVSASNQKVRIEGQLNDEDVWVASQLNEL